MVLLGGESARPWAESRRWREAPAVSEDLCQARANSLNVQVLKTNHNILKLVS